MKDKPAERPFSPARLQGSVPKYRQLAEIIRTAILSGQLPAEAKLPPIAQMATQYAVSLGTVRQAMALLDREGLILSQQGRGTFVRAAADRQVPFVLVNFDPHAEATRSSYRLLAKETIPATTEMATRLDISSGTPTLHIERLRIADDRITAHERRYLAEALCPALLNEDLETQPIHVLLVQKYHVPLIRATYAIEARMLTEQEAAVLEARTGEQAFLVDRLTYTTGNRPAIWYRSLLLGSEYGFKAQFETSV